MPEIRETFAGFAMEGVQTTYTIKGRGESTRAAELVITGPRKGR